MTSRLDEQPDRTFPVLLGELAGRYGDAPALVSARETVSFKASPPGPTATRAGCWACTRTRHRGGPAYDEPAGLPGDLAWHYPTGCVAALLNTNLTGAALAHCMDVAGVRHLIAGQASAKPWPAPCRIANLPPKSGFTVRRKPPALKQRGAR